MESNEQLMVLLTRLKEKYSSEFVLELLETLEDDDQFAEAVQQIKNTTA